MAINQVTLAQLQSEIQALGTQLNSMFYRVQLYAALVIGIGITALQAAPYSMSSADATALFNAAQDLDHFRQVYTGAYYVASGATLNTGVPTANGAGAFGYPFNSGVSKLDGLGY